MVMRIFARSLAVALVWTLAACGPTRDDQDKFVESEQAILANDCALSALQNVGGSTNETIPSNDPNAFKPDLDSWHNQLTLFKAAHEVINQKLAENIQYDFGVTAQDMDVMRAQARQAGSDIAIQTAAQSFYTNPKDLDQKVVDYCKVKASDISSGPNQRLTIQ